MPGPVAAFDKSFVGKMLLTHLTVTYWTEVCLYGDAIGKNPCDVKTVWFCLTHIWYYAAVAYTTV